MATGGSETTSDEIVNFKCTPCGKDNKVREAVKYCVECKGYCCQSCVDLHRRFPTLEGHHLRDKSTLKSTVLKSDLPLVPTDTCDIHEIKILDMYCGNHDVVGCTSCMTLEHRNCTEVHLVSDVIDTHFIESLVKEIHQKIIEMKTQMEEIKSSKVKCLDELEKSREHAINEIKELRKELESILEHLEQESIREVDKCFNHLHSTLQNETEKADNEFQIMKQTAFHLMKSEGNRAQQFVSVKVSQKKIAKTEEVVLALQSGSHDKISFTPHSDLNDTLQKLKSFGSVSCESTLMLRQKSSVYVIKRAKNLNVKTKADSEGCFFYGSCLTDDCELLLADHFNKSLKHVDIRKMSVVDQCSLPSSPYSVCQTQRREAAVTLANNSIQFISLDSQMNTTRQLTLNHLCYGIAYKDDRLYITDYNTSLYIHDMAGTLLRTVSTDESGNNLFMDTRHVFFSDRGKKLFVTDYSKGVIVLDDHMKHSYSFSDSELSGAYAVCSDDRGNILVGGYRSNKVIQIGADEGPNEMMYLQEKAENRRAYLASLIPEQSKKLKKKGENEAKGHGKAIVLYDIILL